MTGLLLVLTASIYGQNRQVSGTVTDVSTGGAIPFASVQIKGTMIGTTTDELGKYVISAPTDGVLIFSFVGYTTTEVSILNRQVVDVHLSPDAINLEDVLVVAYGTAKKESFTGSAAVVKSEKLEKRTVSNITKAVEGLATGVQTTSGSGQPGAGSSVIIRGFGSLSASRDPLYVVDGIPYDGSISAINPNDIESMTILKDASAGALYGARGANGVVMITTKRGSEGTLTVTLKAQVGVASRAIPRYETLDAYQWTEDTYYMFKNEFVGEGYSSTVAGQKAMDAMVSGAQSVFGNNARFNPFSVPANEIIDQTTGRVNSGATLKWSEDWLDAATAKAPIRQDYLLTANGGTKKTHYMFSLGFLNEDGLVTETNFRRYSGRANIDTQVKDWLKTGLNVNFSANSSNMTASGTSSDSNTYYSNIFYSCQQMAPIYPLYEKDANGNTVYDEKGNAKYEWGKDRPAGASAGWNPIANLRVDKYFNQQDNVSGRTFVDVGGMETGALKGLKFSVNFGFDYRNQKSKSYYNPFFGNAESTKGALYITDGRVFSYTFNQLLSYNRTFGKHKIDALVGHEYYNYNYQSLSASKTGFPFGEMYELAAATTIDGANSYQNNYGIESILSRVNYSFDDRYYVSGSYRRDGSSRFHEDSRWGDFWSAGASWRISQESWLKDTRWLNNLTLKASYGVQGNDAIGSLYAWQSFYSLDYPNGANPGAVVSSLESKLLKWEKNENLNIGIEAALFGRLYLTLEYYNRFTRDMLMKYPMAPSLGFDGYNKNIGNMRNSGFELSISGDIIKKDRFRWNMTLMASTVKNTVVSLADKPEIISGNYITKEGETLNSFYLAESAGVDPATGKKLYWVWDEDKDGVKSEKYISDSYTKALTCKSISGSRLPIVYGSWQNDLRLGDFDLNIMTTYSIGGKILDGTYYGLLYSQYLGTAASVDRLKAWKQPGDITSIPKIETGKSNEIARTSDELVDASYFAIKNITLGYNLPGRLAKKIGMHAARVTLTGDNLFIFTARKGLDPQYNFTGSTGFVYTPSRTISIGIDLKF